MGYGPRGAHPSKALYGPALKLVPQKTWHPRLSHGDLGSMEARQASRQRCAFELVSLSAATRLAGVVKSPRVAKSACDGYASRDEKNERHDVVGVPRPRRVSLHIRRRANSSSWKSARISGGQRQLSCTSCDGSSRVRHEVGCGLGNINEMTVEGGKSYAVYFSPEGTAQCLLRGAMPKNRTRVRSVVPVENGRPLADSSLMSGR